jgi:hypothetical protein
MKVEILTLCDAAADYFGKLNILGTFDTIWVKEAPAIFPQCAVALRMRFNRSEDGKHSIRLNVVNEDGKPVVPTLDAQIEVKFGPEESTRAINLTLHLHGLKLDKCGEYSIDLSFNGSHEASLPLFVKKRDAPENIPGNPNQ